MNNNGKDTQKAPARGAKGKSVSIRQAVRIVYKKEIAALVAEEAKEDEDTGARLKYFASALTKMMGLLSEEEKMAAKEKADQWNNERPSKEVQRE